MGDINLGREFFGFLIDYWEKREDERDEKLKAILKIIANNSKEDGDIIKFETFNMMDDITKGDGIRNDR